MSGNSRTKSTDWTSAGRSLHPSRHGESDFIEWLRSLAPSLTEPDKGIGDDAAIVSPPAGRQLVVSTDTLTEDVHFRRHQTAPVMLGRKTLLVNLSDLAAMGAEPWVCLLSLVLPGELARSDYISSLVEGFLGETRRWAVDLVGGNITRGSIVQTSATIVGTVPSGQAVRRDGCREGDAIYLVGRLGHAALGLQILQEFEFEKALASEEELQAIVHDRLSLRFVTSHLLPEPQISAGIWLRKQGLANSMIDVSDGLVSDLQRMVESSFVDIVIQNHALKRLRSEGGERMTLQHILNGGEDYALAFSCPRGEEERLESHFPDDSGLLLRLGEARSTREPAVWLDDGDNQVVLLPQGFDHLK